MVDHADIAAAKNISASLVFFNRKRNVGTLFFDNIIAPSAGLGAGAAVGSSAREIVGQQASSRI